MNASTITKTVLAGLLIIAVASIVGATLHAAPATQESPAAQRQQWEFASLKVAVDRPVREVGASILKMGREGWEMVSVENFVVDGTTTETAYYFKRAIK
jgi:hypothetical protein